jgi:glycosyltransferase involved in cell wall biosynthesis
MTFNPLVSIVIPVYNGENYFKYALLAAISQTYRNLQVIVIDDGSLDPSYLKREIESLGDARVELHVKKNGGVSSALNLGIKKSKGEYFSWLSHDDVIPLYKIESQIRLIQNEYEKDEIIYSSWDHIDEEGKYLWTSRIKSKIEATRTSLGPVEHQVLNAGTMLIPITVFEKVGNFNENLKYVQDYEFFFRCAKRRIPWLYIDLTCCSTRIHEQRDSQTKDVTSENFLIWSSIADFFCQEVREKHSKFEAMKIFIEYKDFVSSQNLQGAENVLDRYLNTQYKKS